MFQDLVMETRFYVLEDNEIDHPSFDGGHRFARMARQSHSNARGYSKKLNQLGPEGDTGEKFRAHSAANANFEGAAKQSMQARDHFLQVHANEKHPPEVRAAAKSRAMKHSSDAAEFSTQAQDHGQNAERLQKAMPTWNPSKRRS